MLATIQQYGDEDDDGLEAASSTITPPTTTTTQLASHPVSAWLQENVFMGILFNAFGEKSNGRICPGKDIAMNLMVELLQELGKVRRGAT
jgi:hypothetical protein